MKETLVLLAFSLFYLLILTESKTLPKYINKCSLKNEEEFTKCAVEEANAALKKFANGDKKYKIPDLDPLKISSLALDTPGLKLTITNVTALGTTNTVIKSISYDKISKRFHMDNYLNNVTITGYYKIDGKILILPIQGEGNGRLSFLDGNYHYNFDFNPVKKNGKEVIKVEHPELTAKFGKAEFSLDNLFNGNQQLTNEMNKFLNENWSDVIEEFNSLVVSPILETVNNVLTGIVNELTYAEVFDDV